VGEGRVKGGRGGGDYAEAVAYLFEHGFRNLNSSAFVRPSI